MPVKRCYECEDFVPCVKNGLCTLLGDDGGPIFAVGRDEYCVYGIYEGKFTDAEIILRDAKSRKEYLKFQNTLERAFERVASWPESKRNALYRNFDRSPL